MAARKRTASRGFVNNIILESLITGDKYGYEIIKMVEEKSNGKIILKQPSLYSSLKRFETKGYITSYWGDSDIGGRRHYYTITETGKNYFNKNINKLDVEDEDENIEDELCEQESLNIEESISENTNPTENIPAEEYDVFSILEHDNEAPPVKKEKLKETAIQVDMFSEKPKNSYFNDEQNVNVSNIQQIKETSPNKVEETFMPEQPKHIPLINENEHAFFNWEENSEHKKLENKTYFAQPKQTENSPAPIKNQIVMDEFGIIKVGETIEKPEKKVFDNVGARIEYNDPVIMSEKKKEKPAEPDLTEEEREKINKHFNQKFEQIITEKTSPQKDIEEIDYKNILGELLASEENETIEPQPTLNHSLEDDDEFIPIQKINAAVTKIEAVKEPAFNEEGFKFKPYQTEVDEKEQHHNFILTNKAKVGFGLFTFVLMLLQISTLFIVLKLNNLLHSADYTLFAIAYGISVAFLLLTLIPYFIAPDKRSANNFRFNYSLLFGVLLFLASCALTYAICTFIGLTSANVSLFATKLLLPTILSINFILAPIIYKMVLQDKKLY